MMYENLGHQKTLEDILATRTHANMLRLKAMLLTFTRTQSEYKVIGFLCEGYKEQDIADVLKVSRQRVNFVIQTYRKRMAIGQMEDIFSILKED